MITSHNKETEFLFQKLGHRWYVFSEIENDMVYSVLPEGVDPRSTKLELYHVIEEHLHRVAKMRKNITEVAA